MLLPYTNIEFIEEMSQNVILQFFGKAERGCRDAYNLILQAHFRDLGVPPPTRSKTACNAYTYNFSPKRWADALKLIPRIISMPHTSSHLLKLMFRVNWTFYKIRQT